jgi:ankyrin repeat protein
VNAGGNYNPVAISLAETRFGTYLLSPDKIPSMVNAYTPLHIAAVEGHAEVTSLLLAAGAAIQVRDERSGLEETPLYLAAVNNHTGVVVQMLDSVGYRDGDAYDWEIYRARNASTLLDCVRCVDAPLANEAIRHRVSARDSFRSTLRLLLKVYVAATSPLIVAYLVACAR